MGAKRPLAYAAVALPMLLLAGAAVWARRRLPHVGAVVLAVIYGLTISFCAYVFSYLAPLGLYMLFTGGMKDGVWMALVQAVFEELWLIIWFSRYLQAERREGSFTAAHAYTAAVLVGLTVAMVEQLLFVYTTGASQPGIVWMRLVLATLPRVGLAWAVTWALLQQMEPGLTRSFKRLLLMVPVAIHAVYSSLFFHVTDMANALVLYLLLLVPFAAVILLYTGKARVKPT